MLMRKRSFFSCRVIAILIILTLLLAPFSVQAADPQDKQPPKPQSTTLDVETQAVVAAGDPTANLIYAVPVDLSEIEPVKSPAVDASAPYTPVVLSLLAQLSPAAGADDATVQAAYANMTKLLTHGGTSNLGGGVSGCWGTGPVGLPSGTTPSIERICWADAQGILMTSGDLSAQGTTGPMTLMGLGSSFDRNLANIWGQTAGKEARWYMITGIYGPQGDIGLTSNWSRNLTTTGEDPLLSYDLVAEQVHGMQGAGAMSQMKHFTVYNGQNGITQYQDQWLHEIELAPYEGGYVAGMASSAMCSYQASQNTSTLLPDNVSSVWPKSPFSIGSDPHTWPLNEAHFACEQPMLLNYVLRQQWGSLAHVATDYGAIKSTSSILQGNDQEMPSKSFFGSTNPSGGASSGPMGASGLDPTGSTCADTTGKQVDCSASGAIHVAGIPTEGKCLPDATNGGGCGLVDATRYGSLPVSMLYQSMARLLYQEERFGLLGCSDKNNTTCTNPGGNGGNTGDTAGDKNGTRSGQVLLPNGSALTTTLGTKSTDAAVVEKMSEEGAVLLKNQDHVLPVRAADLDGGILVTGANANHTIADPTGEASIGFADRNAINPLQQLKAFTGRDSAFTFVPANDPAGMPVPAAMFSTDNSLGTPDGSLNLSMNGGAAAAQTTAIDYTTVSSNGQLAANTTYDWTGYLYAPTTDNYQFRFQHTNSSAISVTFEISGTASALGAAEYVYGSGTSGIAGSPTTAGYTEGGLLNKRANCTTQVVVTPWGSSTSTVCNAYPLTAGHYYPVHIKMINGSASPASLRFAQSREQGDIDAAAAAAAGKSLAIVFVNDNSSSSTISNPYGSGTLSSAISLSAASNKLVQAVAAANPNTVVVLNSANPVLMPWIDDVKGVLSMWFAGQEGGTSTARLLLGLANPGGHTSITWPANATDTIWGYDQTEPLYEGDTTGPHPERMGVGNNCGMMSIDCASTFTQGIYSGYRYFDKLGIEPLFPFGHGLSYTQFRFNNLAVAQADDGGVDVTFTLSNVGSRQGAEVTQVYVGPPADAASLESVQFAVRSLAQFERIELNAGQSKTVTLHVGPRQLSYWSEKDQKWVWDLDGRILYVGNSSSLDGLPLSTVLTASARTETVCRDIDMVSTLVAGDLIVPDGAWCDLSDVTVTGDLVVGATSGVRVINSTVKGSITATGAASAEDPHSLGANVIAYTRVGGDIVITGSAVTSPWSLGPLGENTVTGKVLFNNNASDSNVIANTTVTGVLSCQGNGDVTAKDNQAAQQLYQCGSGVTIWLPIIRQ